MPRKDSERKVIGPPIIELETDREMMDIHIFRKQKISDKKKKERPIICNRCINFGHPEKNCNKN